MGTKITVDTIENVDNSSGLATLNDNLQALADEFDEVLYLDGTVAMNGDLDMDSNRIYNLPEPVGPTEAARKAELDAALVGIEDFAIRAETAAGIAVQAQPVSVLSVGPFSALSTLTIPAGTNIIRTTHYGPRAGRGGALYRRWDNTLATLPAWGQGVWWQQAADGSRWFLSQDQGINSDMFGTIGDAVVTYPGTLASGTDVTANLNNMRRWGLNSTWGKPYGFLTVGNHRVDDTVMLSLGESYTRAYTLWGETLSAYGLWDNNGLPCARIISTKNDRPTFSVQGCRGGSLRYVSIYCVSGLSTRIINENLGRGAVPIPTVDDRLPTDWMTGVTGANSIGRYNPGCAVAIDPYSGVAPAGAAAYPTPPYSSAAGESTVHYGRVRSSQFIAEGNEIGGFTIGVAIQPCDQDGNGDFIETPNNGINYCIYAIAVGNSQSRGLNTANLKCTNVHTVLDSVTFGRQSGSVGGHHSNWSIGQSIQFFNIGLGYSAPVTVVNLYCESFWRFGNVSGNGHLRLIGMRSSYLTGSGPSEVSPIRGFPTNHIGASPNSGAMQTCRVSISGDLTVAGLFIVNSNSVDLDISMQQVLHPVGSTQPPYVLNMHNALCGGIAVAPTYSTAASDIKVRATYDPRNVSSATVASTGGVRHFDGEVVHRSSRLIPAPIWATQHRGTNFQNTVELPIQSAALGGGTSGSLTNNKLTMTYAGYFTAGLHQTAAMLPGDVWRHNSGYWASVQSFDTTTGVIILHIWNGFSLSGGTYTWHIGSAATALSTMTSGTWYTYGARRYGLDYPLWGTFTSGSANVTAVGRVRGVSAATSLVSNVGVGDQFLCVPEEQGSFGHPRNVITARDETAKTITGTAGLGSDQTVTRPLTFTTSAIPNTP